MIESVCTYEAYRVQWSLQAGYSQATDLAEVIMLEASLPYKTAHRIVGEAISAAIQAGISAAEIPVELIEEAAERVIGRHLGLDATTLAESLDPWQILATRTTSGGASPEAVRRMIRQVRKATHKVRMWRRDTARRTEAAEGAVVELAASMAGGNV